MKFSTMLPGKDGNSNQKHTDNHNLLYH